MITRPTRVSIGVLTAVVVLLYTPTILYGARLFGFELARPSIGGQQIDMEAWWISVSAPDSFLRNLLGRAGIQQVVFVKAGGWLPGFSETLVVSKAKGIPSDDVLKGGKVIKVKWGEMLVVPRDSSREPYEHAFARESGLFLTGTDLKVFHDIRSIRTISVDK